MAKTESSLVIPPAVPPVDSGSGGSATRTYSGDSPTPASEQVPVGAVDEQLTASPASAVPPDQQQTVISKRQPNGDSSFGATASPFELGSALEGQRLGHFELEEFVGGGGMGAVFRARDTQLGRIVAVKVLSRDQAADAETVRRFKNEAQSAARLDHENIARVHYVGEDRGWNYIVFEFIEGINIRDMVLQNGPLSLAQAVSFTLQVAEALSHAARRDVVHRDIKPSNVLITAAGKAKLVDMGLARLHHVESSQADLTASGVTLGTFDYISPEQARDPRLADVRSDLYSLGCTFYYMLTARPPFPEGTVLQKLLSHSSEPPPDPRQFRPDLPQEVTDILAKMLSKHPDDRQQEPSELIGELLLMSEQLGLPVAERGAAVWITPGQVRIPAWGRHLPWAVPVGILLLVVLLLHFSAPSRQPASVTKPHPRPAPRTSAARDLVREPGADATGGAGTLADPRAAASAGEEVAREPGAGSDVVDAAGREPPSVGDDPGRPPNGDNGRGPVNGNEAQLPAGEGPAAAVEVARMAGGPPADEAETGGPAKDVESEAPVAPGESPPRDRVALPVEPHTLIVGEGGLSSLGEALAKPPPVDGIETIELRFDGPMTLAAFSLVDRRITIRAGAGYAPLLMLRPTLDDLIDQRSSMITIVGGELVLEGVHLEFTVPREPIDQWSLFKLQDIEMLRLFRCTMTIRNDEGERAHRHRAVAFFDLGSGLSSDQGAAQPLLNYSAIDMDRCVARGEAVLVRANAGVPMRLSWTGGFLVTTERLLHVSGSRQRPPDDGSRVEIDLDHVTAIVDDGLAKLAATQDMPYQRTVVIKSNDGILMTHPGSPLIEQRGPGELDQLREQFVFSGRGNFYPQPQVQVFRRIESTTDSESAQVDFFSGWSTAWEDEKFPQRTVRWARLPEPSRPVNQLIPADYGISLQLNNPAYRSSGDQSNAGCDVDVLPLPPAIDIIALPPEVLIAPAFSP